MSASTGAALPKPTTQAESMAQLRSQLDPLVAQLGTLAEVRMNKVVPCGASDGSDGYAATYAVWMTPAGGAQDTVAQTVVPQFTADGWRVEKSPRTDEVDWSFHRTYLDLGLTFHPDQNRLVVDGSGACLPQKE